MNGNEVLYPFDIEQSKIFLVDCCAVLFEFVIDRL